MYPSDSIKTLFNFFINYIMKLGSRQFIIVIGTLAFIACAFQG